MGFFANLFGRHSKHSTANQLPIKIATPAPSLEVYDQVVDLIVFSEPLQQQMKKSLAAAFDNPRAFYDEQEEFLLAERSMTYTKHVDLTPKFVLIDTLIEHQQMAEVDWKEAEDEIRGFV